MKCIHCGKEIADGAKFCLNCGAKIADMVTENVPAPEVPAEPPKAEIPEAPKPAFCAKCGSPLAEGQKFCLKCGAAADGKAKAAKSGKGIDKKWFIIGGCALAAIILAVVLIIVLAGGGVGSDGASSPEAVGEACFETQLDGARIGEGSVAVDGNIVTARGAGVATQFALKLVELVVSKAESDRLFKAILCEK